MIIFPSFDELMKRNDNKYILIVKVAKRARQLVSGNPPLVNISSSKEVTIAVNEIYEGKIMHVKKKED